MRNGLFLPEGEICSSSRRRVRIASRRRVLTVIPRELQRPLALGIHHISYNTCLDFRTFYMTIDCDKDDIIYVLNWRLCMLWTLTYVTNVFRSFVTYETMNAVSIYLNKFLNSIQWFFEEPAQKTFCTRFCFFFAFFHVFACICFFRLSVGKRSLWAHFRGMKIMHVLEYNK